METCFAAIDNGVWEDEGVPVAEVVPEFLLVVWQYEDKVDAGDRALESFERMHQHRAPADGQELLRQVCTHAQTFASSNDDGVVAHLTSHHSIP